MDRHFKANKGHDWFVPRLYIFALAALLISQSTAFGQQDRITGRIGSSGTVLLRGGLNPKAQLQYDEGRVDADLKMHLVTLVFSPSPAQQTALRTLLAEQQERSSPSYHKWISPEQYADRFGLSRGDIDRIASWLRSKALTVDYSSRGRNWLTFSGTAHDVELAFSAEIHRYRVDGETHFANATDPSIPAELANVVVGISGMDDFRMKAPTIRRKGPFNTRHSVFSHPEYTLTDGTHALLPDDLATIYDIWPLYANGINGAGERIAIVGQSDIDVSDIANFRTGVLPPNPPQVLLVPGSSDPGMTEDESEADLDLEWVGSVARGATLYYVNSTSALVSVVYAISENVAPVVSSSFGLCERDQTVSATLLIGTVAQQGNLQGITLLSASGDSGAAGCDSDTTSRAANGLGVWFPASLPDVTAVGGTEFSEGIGTYWSGTNSSTFASALSYIPEIAWNDTALGSLSASGGGMSSLYLKPAWQAGPGVPNDGARDVPDVAMAASPNHDPYLVVSGGAVYGVGGTSAATPVFAGIVALLNQYYSANGEGNINPNLYRIPQTSAFHDIVSGNNIVPCVAGTPNCTAGSFGYNAAPGYDLVTGLGAVDAYILVANWNYPAPVSKVAPSCNPNPVYELAANAQGYSWFYTITLTETAGVATSLTGFRTNGTDYSSQIASDFGTSTIPARGTVSAVLELKNLTVPTNVVFVFSGVDAGGRQWSQQLSVPFNGPASLPANSPTINPGGIVPLYSSTPAIQPGSWISIYGSNLANSTVLWNGDFPTSLGNVSVTIDGKAGYLWFVSSGQITLQAPDDAATGVVPVIVTTPNGTATSTVTLAQFAPSFLVQSDAKHVLAIVVTPGSPGNSGAGYDVIGPSRPVKAGETLQIYGVGFGPTMTAVAAGMAYASATSTVNPVQVTIGGVTVPQNDVQFSGVIEAGLYQLNLLVPSNLGTGDQPIVASTGGAQTQSNVLLSLQ